MTELAIATEHPSHRQIARREASKPHRVTGRLKKALDLMVWDGLTDNKAALKTGLSLTAIRLAFQRQHVRAYVHEQRQVLQARECGRNFHTLLQVRDQKRNAMARIKAVQAIEQTSENASGSKHMAPGFVVQIINVQPAPLSEHQRQIDDKPLIDNEAVRNDE